jgi:hypothetical protein
MQKRVHIVLSTSIEFKKVQTHPQWQKTEQWLSREVSKGGRTGYKGASGVSWRVTVVFTILIVVMVSWTILHMPKLIKPYTSYGCTPIIRHKILMKKKKTKKKERDLVREMSWWNRLELQFDREIQKSLNSYFVIAISSSFTGSHIILILENTYILNTFSK